MKDKKLQNLIKKEVERQAETLDLIASENIVSREIMAILGSPLTNKYSEGYPGKRYYPGNIYYDEIETLCQERALKAFNLNPEEWSANVQAYSGSPANFEIYFGLLNPGDKIMGMGLAAGGHLTHGHKANLSGKIFESIQYRINPQTGLIDYDELEKLAMEHKPKLIISGATAYPREINFQRIGKIAKKINAYHLADISHIAGLVLTGLHQSPFPYADIAMTTTHKTLRGPRGAIIFSRKELSPQIDKMVFPGMQGGPHDNVIAAMTQMFFEVMQPGFRTYAKQIIKNSKTLAESLKSRGFILLTHGTDNHLLLIDLKNLKLDGIAAEKKLEAAGIIANRNSLQGDPSPFNPSGIRMGTASLTTRGMKEYEMKKIAEWTYRILMKKENPEMIKKEVKILCRKFPAFK